MTNSNNTISTEQLAVFQDEQAVCAAVLPYWPIWAAAQFASTDEAKIILQFVHVWRDGDNYQIESTDGHRAFRYRLPAFENGMPTLWRIPDDGLLLQAKQLKKQVSYARLLTVTHDLRAVFHGGRKTQLDELSSVNLAGCCSVYTASDCSKAGTYPNINQLWPESFTNAPGKSFAFNADYLGDVCKVISKLGGGYTPTVKFHCNAPITPFVINAVYEPRVGQHFSDSQLEILLMPVQVRS